MMLIHPSCVVSRILEIPIRNWNVLNRKLDDFKIGDIRNTYKELKPVPPVEFKDISYLY